MKFKSVRQQLIWSYVLTLLLLISLLAVATYVSLRWVMIDNLDDQILNGTGILAAGIGEYQRLESNDPKSLVQIEDDEREYYGDEFEEEVAEVFLLTPAYVQVRSIDQSSETSKVLWRSSALTPANFPQMPIADDEFPQYSNCQIGAESVRFLSYQVPSRDGYTYLLQVGLSRRDMDETLRNLLRIYLLILPGLLLLLLGVGHIFVKRAFSPIGEMVAITKRITANDLARRLPDLESADEVGELVLTLNHMISRLEHSFRQIRQFSGDVSHELKTPLAKLINNAEIILRQPRSPEETRQMIANLLDDARQMNTIISDLLLLAQLDTQRHSLHLENLPLHELFKEVFENACAGPEMGDIEFALEVIEPVHIQAEPGLIRRLLENLIANAIQYTPPPGTITLALYSRNNRAELIISDTGIGISETEHSRIFERFFRVEQSRSRETGGVGLGLSLVQKICELHNAEISISSAIGKGSTFVVSFPAIEC